MTLEEFIEKCQKQPLPSNLQQQVRRVAKDLAEGVHYDLWSLRIYTQPSDEIRGQHVPEDVNMYNYFVKVWNDPHIRTDLLIAYEFYHNRVGLTKSAFDLLEEADPATIFISYKRSESSAFALLLEQSLIQVGLSPFLDKQLQAGDDWHAELENRIRDSDYLIILLGQETLKSEVTLREITWAIQYKTGIIPIWHNDFSFDIDDWPDLDSEISEAISSKHAIRVLEENPLLYDTALRELLNRFGITM